MKKYLFLIFFLLFSGTVWADMIIGGETLYTARKGDTIERIGAIYGVPWKKIAEENGLDIRKPLKKGQELKVNNRRILPKTMDNGIIINIPDRTLYFFKEGKLQTSFPVGLGKVGGKGKKGWHTPLGNLTVLQKEKNPTWRVPESIQAEMEAEGKQIKIVVPPGPDNPLGRYALKTSISGILIHETIWPGSVYQFRSHGCIRVAPEHMERFFPEVAPNTPGELIYIPVKVALSENGRVFLEVHRDSYGMKKNLKAEAITMIEKLGVSTRVDWEKADRVLREKSGIVEDITL